MKGFSLNIVHAGHEGLRRPAQRVTRERLRSAATQQLIVSMVRTVREASGVGLSATQVDESLRIIVLEDRADALSHVPQELLDAQERVPLKLEVLVNPSVTPTTDESAESFEGCLSVPGYVGLVRRARTVLVEALNPQGGEVRFEATGWHARILQHEVDHLDGVLFTDRIVPKSLITRAAYRRRWQHESIEKTKQKLGVS